MIDRDLDDQRRGLVGRTGMRAGAEFEIFPIRARDVEAIADRH